MVVDANVFLAVILNEPEKESIIKMTKEVELVSPEIVTYEVGNALSSMVKQDRLRKEQALKAYGIFEMIPFIPIRVNIPTALDIACEFKSYAYDAYYLEVTNRLSLPLLTMDKQMKNNGLSLGLKLLEI
jgi:predicted nucleic acid-binding protein